MKTLTAPMLAELSLTITSPGYLVQIGYGSTLRLSSMGDITYGSATWLAADLKVSGVKQDGKGGNSASMSVGNTDNTYGAIVLNEGASDIPVIIYACYAGAPGEAVQVFSGVTDGAEISVDKVQFTLVAQANKTLFCPRVFIAPPVFNFLQPEGTRVPWGSEVFSLDRRQ